MVEGQLNEPGLCVSHASQQLYVADTNNHCTKVVQLEDKTVEKLEIFLPQEVKQVKSKKTGTVLPTDLTISSAGGEISLIPSVALDGLILTDGAPQKWALEFPDTSWSATTSSRNTNERRHYTYLFQSRSKLPPRVSLSIIVCHEHSECKTYALSEPLYMLKVHQLKLSTILLTLSDRIKRNLQADHHNPSICFIFVTTQIFFSNLIEFTTSFINM